MKMVPTLIILLFLSYIVPFASAEPIGITYIANEGLLENKTFENTSKLSRKAEKSEGYNSAVSEFVNLTYIGNAGFLIECHGKKILIDALFGRGESFTRCANPSDDLLYKMESAQSPFDNVDLIAATHHHRDHFTAVCVAQHLANNPKAQFVSTDDAVNLLKTQCTFFDRIKDRVHGLDLKVNESQQLSLNGITIKAFGTTHSPPHIVDNLVMIFDVNGYKILHTGDTSAPNRTQYATMNLPQEEINVGLIHKGFFLWSEGKGKTIVSDMIQPDHIILNHVYNDEITTLTNLLPKLKETFPNLHLIPAPMDTLRIQLKQVLRLGVNNWYFWHINRDGKCSGTMVDIWREIANRNGLELELFPIRNLEHMKAAMEENSIDVFGSMVKTPERTQYIAFIEPPFRTKLKVLTYVKAGSNTSIDKYEDMYGKKVALVEASYGRIAHDPNINKEKIGSNTAKAFDELLAENIDAVLICEWRAMWHLRNGKYKDKVKLAGYTYNEYHPCYLVMSKKSAFAENWKDRFGRTIQEIIDDGTMKKIIDSYVPDWYEIYSPDLQD